MAAPIEFEPLKADAARSRTLPGHFYHAPEIYEQEKSRIFDRTWQIIAHEIELSNAGDYVTAEIAEEKIFAIRGDDGVLRAFYNVCQHRAHTLLTGTGNIKTAIMCPYHAWTYTTTGALRTARHTKNMPDFEVENFSLPEVRLETACGFIFVNLDSGALSIEETWPGFIDSVNEFVPWWPELEIHSRNDSLGNGELAANWKVLAENCRECYHCGPSHPAFVDLINMKTYEHNYYNGWLLNVAPIHHHKNAAYDVDPDEPCQQTIYWHLWPNNLIGISPGEKNMGMFRYYPSGPETTRMSSVFLADPDIGIKQERLDYISNTLWTEDEGICAAVQQGLKSKGYRQGRFVVDTDTGDDTERPVHEFQLQYVKQMDLEIEG